LRRWAAEQVCDDVPRVAQEFDPRNRLLNYTGKLGGIFTFSTFSQAIDRLLNRKPGAIAVRLLRIAEPSHLAEMSTDELEFSRESHLGLGILFPVHISDECSLFNPAMNSSLLECFNRRGLRMSEPWLRAAFGKYPTPRAAGLD